MSQAKGGQEREETAAIYNQIIGAGMYNVQIHVIYCAHSDPRDFSPLFKSSYNEAIFFSPIRGVGS